MNISLRTTKKEEMIDLTAQVQEQIVAAGMQEGLCHLFCLHTSAALIINENYDPKICNDIFTALEKIIPDKAGYEHDIVDGNAASHIKAALLGPGEVVPVKDGKLQLGQWQAITFVELDGPRQRQVKVTLQQ